MDALEAILTRHSIRRYTAEPVGEELVRQVLAAAMSAPSACNEQPWHFVVIDDRATLDAIPEYHAYSTSLKRAPVGVVICADDRAGTLLPYWPQDCAAATQNLLLAAHALGLGAVWLGIYPEADRIAKTRQLLHLPEKVVPFCVISMGHPAVKAVQADRYDPARVHRNRWE